MNQLDPSLTISHVPIHKTAQFLSMKVAEIFYSQRTVAEEILNYTNNINMHLRFKTAYDENAKIKFLDLLITRNEAKITTDIFRKPTTTDYSLQFLSPYRAQCSSKQISFKQGVPPLSQESKKQENNTIIQIARNNGYTVSIITKLNNIKSKNDNKITDCTRTRNNSILGWQLSQPLNKKTQ